mmetsp:Transcript_27484/g.69917  ORF Transcript_27484/g.69917 Transcript_27484/m.69917 type:complete len:375 (-) Transcript_27484:637-1761(-)
MYMLCPEATAINIAFHACDGMQSCKPYVPVHLSPGNLLCAEQLHVHPQSQTQYTGVPTAAAVLERAPHSNSLTPAKFLAANPQPAPLYVSSSSSLMAAACACSARLFLTLSCSSVWLTTPMRTSISCSSSASFLIAFLMRTTGVASAMLVECSSMTPFISLSCSVMRCSSLLRSLMASVRALYEPCTVPSEVRAPRYCCMRRSNWSLRKRSRVCSLSSDVSSSPRSFSSTVRDSGHTVEMDLVCCCTSSRWLRQSLASALSRMRSLGATRSTSIFHAVGSTLLARMAFSSAMVGAGEAWCPGGGGPSAASCAPLPIMYASSSSSSRYLGLGNSVAASPSMPPASASSTSPPSSSWYPSGMYSGLRYVKLRRSST